MGDESYVAEASELLGAVVIAAGIFDPNVPDVEGGIVGLLTWPARRVRLRNIGDVKATCLLAVTQNEIHAVRAHLRIRGFRLGDPIAQWRRDEAITESVAVASWFGHPPTWPAIRITATSGRPVAELQPNAVTASTQAVIAELLGH
jgi:hypothetical protein